MFVGNQRLDPLRKKRMRVGCACFIVGGVVAACEVSIYYINQRVKLRSQMKQSAFADLHRAKAEGLA